MLHPHTTTIVYRQLLIACAYRCFTCDLHATLFTGLNLYLYIKITCDFQKVTGSIFNKFTLNYNLNDEVSTLTPGPIVVVTATDLK